MVSMRMPCRRSLEHISDQPRQAMQVLAKSRAPSELALGLPRRTSHENERPARVVPIWMAYEKESTLAANTVGRVSSSARLVNVRNTDASPNMSSELCASLRWKCSRSCSLEIGGESDRGRERLSELAMGDS